ncbi:putative epoxide hydrolase [Cladophialophora carrionii]|uniref:Putative epoxide hydrolase n=1 Tax=Cladophialophora carrionii TaxID=86049 RepID=A0A1C1CR61_9EURO|nr:putative epoxide hydrolase [Cladophialophora carrionii]
MDKLEKKTLDVSRGFTYTYYTSPAKDKKPTLLLIHGFPDAPDTFEEAIRDYLLPNGYGIIAIDCLGYNGTSKPTDTESYNFQLMAQDIKEIVDKEGLDKVVPVGHDWGAGVAQRFYNFHADRCSGLVLMNVSYLIPTPDQPFSLDGVLQFTEGIFGYGIYWYWQLFTAEDGAEIMGSHLDSMWDVAHGAPETWLDTLCKKDGVRDFILADKRQPTMAYATEERKQKWIASFKEAPGFDAPLNYYRAMVSGVQDEANKHIPKENIPINVPFLFFGGQRDYVCRPEMLQLSLDAGLIPDCTKVVIDSGHWAHLEKPKEFGEAIVGWLKEKF